MAMPASHYFTAADVLAMPEDGNKYEVVRGELLVTPMPRPLHEVVLARLRYEVTHYLGAHPVGFPFGAGDLSWTPDTLVSPDLFVVPMEEARTLRWATMRSLLLAVEVLSPSTARYDRFTKRRLYQEVGVPLYWLVDADAKLVEVWTPEAMFPAAETASISWHPDGATAPLVINLEELFRPL